MAVHYARRGQAAEAIASMTNDTSYQSNFASSIFSSKSKVKFTLNQYWHPNGSSDRK
jgi:hypothetical protein